MAPIFNGRALPEYKILKHKLKQRGFSVRFFYEKGNGIKSLLDKTGRLTDFRGLFLFSQPKSRFVYVRESDHVLHDIQQTVRGERQKDEQFLRKIAGQYGFRSALAGQEYLKSMEVRWIEVFQKSKRLSLCHTIQSLGGKLI